MDFTALRTLLYALGLVRAAFVLSEVMCDQRDEVGR